MRLIVGIALLALAAPAWAQRVGPEIPMATQGGNPDLAVAEDGRFGLHYGRIYSLGICFDGRRYLADGTPEGPYTQVSVGAYGGLSCVYARSAYGPDGSNVVVANPSLVSASVSSAIWAWVTDPSGEPVGAPLRLAESSTPSALGPEAVVTSCGSNRFAAAWLTRVATPNYSWGYRIGGIVFDPRDGGHPLVQLAVGNLGSGYAQALDLASDTQGRLALAWAMYDTAFTNPRVRLQLFDPDGRAATAPIGLDEATYGRGPSVTFLSDGRALVTWIRKEVDQPERVAARIVGSDGTASERLDLGETVPTYQRPRAVPLVNGGFAVAALRVPLAGGAAPADVRAYDAGGQALGPVVPLSSLTTILDIHREGAGDMKVLLSGRVRPIEEPLDYGDAPAPYPTTRAVDGARHAPSALRLGARVDVDTTEASDDAEYTDDEDGVVFPAALVRGRQSAVTVNASAAGRLDAWIDFDGDGTWEDAEQVAASLPVVPGNNSLGFVVPAEAVTSTWSRFRISSAGGLGVTGRAPDGEVEDHLVTTVLPYVLTVNGFDVAESAGKVFMPIQLSPAQGVPLTVTWSVESGTATRNVDVAGGPAQVTFLPGQTLKAVPVVVRNDLRDEDAETFRIVLTNAACQHCVRGDGSIQIVDDDPMPQVLVQNTAVAEGTALPREALFKIVVLPVSGRAVQIAYTTESGTAGAGDFTAKAGTVTIPAGMSNATVAVPVTPDATDEFDETFALRLTAATNANLGRTVGTALVRDDDAPPALAVVDARVEEPDAGTAPRSVTVNLSSPSAKTVVVPWTTVALTTGMFPARPHLDFVPGTGTLTFPPGTTSATVDVKIIGDDLFEYDEPFVVRLLAPVNATRLDELGLVTIVGEFQP